MHDNATPDSAQCTTDKIVEFVLPYPQHSPDLAPSDFYLSGRLKDLKEVF